MFETLLLTPQMVILLFDSCPFSAIFFKEIMHDKQSHKVCMIFSPWR